MESLLVSPAGLVRTYFLATAALITSLNVLPEQLRMALMDYGPRRGADAGAKGVLSLLNSYSQVPHSWYWHFYMLSVTLSGFWGLQFVTHGSVMKVLATSMVASGGGDASTDLGSVYAAWFMMALQGMRRLYECFFVMRPGKSPMLALHWVVGLGFYAAMSVAVWAEGSGAILASWDPDLSPAVSVSLSPRVPWALVVFVIASIAQNQCHSYLAGLKKYTLPEEGSFKYIICPHYTYECIIYLAMAFLTAPQGRMLNTTVLCGVVFAAANLATTAVGTRRWYVGKFGPESVAKKWAIFPGIF